MKKSIEVLKWIGVIIIIIVAIIVAPEARAATDPIEAETFKSALSHLIMASMAIFFVAIVLKELIKKYLIK
jgi:hypothetical protein